MSKGKKKGNSAPKNANSAIEAAFKILRVFLTDREPQSPDLAHSQIAANGKTVDLDRESILQFHKLQDAFDRYAELSQTLTRRSVQRSVGHAIVNHFDAGDVAATVRALRQELSRPTKTFTVYVPVVGFDQHSVPGAIGGIPIIGVEEGKKLLLANIAPVAQKVIAANLSAWPRTTPSARGALFAVNVENAVESGAAIEIALERTRQLVDVLHFFSTGHDLSDSGIYLAEGHDRPQTLSVVASMESESGDFTVTPIHAGSGPAFSLSRHSNNPAWGPTTLMLAKDAPNQVESLLLTSMAWSGRATKESKRDLAFTQFAIALESLMIPSGTSEVTERLATRVTHLLSAKLQTQTRLEMFREIKRYYGIRSKVVHNGLTAISSVDLYGFHHLVKWATRRLVRVCDQLRIEKLEDLEEWLTQLVLGAVTVPEPKQRETRSK